MSYSATLRKQQREALRRKPHAFGWGWVGAVGFLLCVFGLVAALTGGLWWAAAIDIVGLVCNANTVVWRARAWAIAGTVSARGHDPEAVVCHCGRCSGAAAWIKRPLPKRSVHTGATEAWVGMISDGCLVESEARLIQQYLDTTAITTEQFLSRWADEQLPGTRVGKPIAPRSTRAAEAYAKAQSYAEVKRLDGQLPIDGVRTTGREQTIDRHLRKAERAFDCNDMDSAMYHQSEAERLERLRP